MLDSLLPDSSAWLKFIQIGCFVLGTLLLFYSFLAGIKASSILEGEVGRLEKQQEPRRLTKEQKSHLMRVLSKYPGAKIKVQSWATDYEATQFADDFATALKEAGWKVDLGRIAFGPNWFPLGVSLEVSYHDQASDSAEAFIRALKEIGMRPKVDRRAGHADPGLESLEFRVGQK